MSYRLKFCPYGQAKVVDRDGGKALISYNMEVAFIDKSGYLSIKGKFSGTTCRHISAFVREYAGDVLNGYNLKSWEWLITDKAAVNINTGKVSEWGRYS